MRLSFPLPISSAREVNGIEEEMPDGQCTIVDGKLSFNIGRYQPKTFAVRVPMMGIVTYGGESEVDHPGYPVALPYNIDLMSYDSVRWR